MSGSWQEPGTVLVTGGAGFIGSNLVRMLVTLHEVSVVNLDKLTYAGNLDSLADLERHPRHHFVRADVCDREAVRAVLARHRPEAVVHLAAESHVDRSIDAPASFVQTNVVGTFTLLEEARRHWEGLEAAARESFRLLLVSTDEVYGSLGEEGAFTEASPYDPSSPYSASKAGADHLARAYHRTYGLPLLITCCSNNYGPYQLPEKLIPLTIHNALRGEPLPVYGRGANVRDWIYVEDHARALWRVVNAGSPGETYNIGVGGQELRNIEVVRRICAQLDAAAPPADNPRVRVDAYRELITFVEDRPGHDHRYAIDSSKIERELGWRPQEDFDSGLRRTIRWYLDNQPWVQRVTSGAYRGWIERNYGARLRGEAGE